MANELYIGIGGCVLRINPETGEEVWRTKIWPAKGLYIAISRKGEALLAAIGGELFRLDTATGEILWHNKLKGLGSGIISFAGSQGDVDEVSRTSDTAAML